MLQVEKLRKVYGQNMQYEALKGIDLTVKDGEFVGIMGPSGSGKSTFLNLIATIDQPTSGKILLNGKNPNELDQEKIAQFRRTQLGFVFQAFNLLPTLTVEENIVLPLTLDGEKVAVMKKKVRDIAPRLGIEGLLNKRIAEISGGQAQRVAVARAMVHQPELLLADEPTGNLDTKSSKDVMGLLRQLNEEEQATILLVTHDPLAASYCQRIVFIKDGELVHDVRRQGTQKEFYEEILVDLARIEGVDNEF
ncbi:ABC transporter ATP-binding protein [Enterococcus saccharolyticus]|uniref:ABC transporter ATP-binding protein n=1 Tax=Enterococcus saccharolyticus subsp. saccharolyticus ATCC 43076 TaxID=1139996 RepID=S0JQ62_9ENTE|nr:ABC transporter ATP-binding protein [Enterococcus saccharolyticus]EOT30675.1 ABC transporter ATP-binding protein [Enterococcus saccharolyticus subsp. saccharolyticus ATCC 43076]EOT80236.1 ABC transporter ATP-binding protein [Enterococcus saccharolyticus subsp. saccharolyticus ATCC 43076]OJG88865.1 ABC transporter ATP-binding protein [Enterococcus saccharolyticus]